MPMPGYRNNELSVFLCTSTNSGNTYSNRILVQSTWRFWRCFFWWPEPWLTQAGLDFVNVMKLLSLCEGWFHNSKLCFFLGAVCEFILSSWRIIRRLWLVFESRAMTSRQPNSWIPIGGNNSLMSQTLLPSCSSRTTPLGFWNGASNTRLFVSKAKVIAIHFYFCAHIQGCRCGFLH